MDLSTGYKIVKLSAKKKHDELMKYKEKFIELAVSKGCSEKIAKDMFHLIELSAEYSFNLSHSVSYSLLAYESAWLKYYYTAVFMKHLLSNKYINGKKAEYAAVVRDTLDCGINLLPPDINKSQWEFTTEGEDIRVGLCAIKGLGDKAAAHLLEKRKEIGGKFDGIAQFIDSTEKKSFNRSKVIVGIFSGLFDSLIGKKESRRSVYEWYCQTYLNEEPLDSVTVTKDFQIDTKSRAKKTLERMFFGSSLSKAERGNKK
jgi:DNA polymerase-3 subunit alpha